MAHPVGSRRHSLQRHHFHLRRQMQVPNRRRRIVEAVPTVHSRCYLQGVVAVVCCDAFPLRHVSQSLSQRRRIHRQTRNLRVELVREVDVELVEAAEVGEERGNSPLMASVLDAVEAV